MLSVKATEHAEAVAGGVLRHREGTVARRVEDSLDPIMGAALSVLERVLGPRAVRVLRWLLPSLHHTLSQEEAAELARRKVGLCCVCVGVPCAASCGTTCHV